MPSYPILCAGPHIDPPTLGFTDNPTPPALGMLCEDCGIVYAIAVTDGRLAAGTIPDEDKIAKVLAVVKPTYDKTSYKPPKVAVKP